MKVNDMCDLLKSSTTKQRCAPAAPSTATALYRFGRVYATPGALAMLGKHQVSAAALLEGHGCGDYGNAGADSVRDSQLAIDQSLRVLSSYRLLDDRTLAMVTTQKKRRSPQCWVITEADSSSTTILLPDEY